MRRFWIILPIAVALVAPPAFAGKLDSVERAAKTYIAKKGSGGISHGKASHGKASHASGLLSKGKKLLGK
jgi:hypothetical protein